ncbi:hypothetical protein [Leptolinea tardivitalis]|uniref:Uncharacterized protein n=1 Tax=Leptolinea tardivitalis TaxID=229920 RepID=A0A0P6WXY8_9CHLR|nr:hypothetical protein [Leptolinea tardivitalis]KPL75071.1 hypothetical protein ADM99_00110 [Leptolinea tardivitalis]GAP20464.1 hypothetical protein LTAR_00655 [Leptolinea tardivitalis]
MANKKIDGVIEAVRYNSEGLVELVRGYEKRGPVYSDRILFTRDQLLQRLRTGKKFYVGERIPLLASTFKLGNPISLSDSTGFEVIQSEASRIIRDYIPDAPLF